MAVEAMLDPRLSNYHLSIVGEGPLRASLERFVSEHGLGDRVTFFGRLAHEETIRAIESSRILVHPAVREGASWVVGEAAAVGVPAVVFEGSGAGSTVLLSNNGGVIVSGGQAGGLAAPFVDAILKVAASEPPAATDRWDASRIPHLIADWWRS